MGLHGAASAPDKESLEVKKYEPNGVGMLDHSEELNDELHKGYEAFGLGLPRACLWVDERKDGVVTYEI